MENEVTVCRADQMDRFLIEGKEEVKELDRIGFSGELFLSPAEELLAICTDSLIRIMKMS